MARLFFNIWLASALFVTAQCQGIPDDPAGPNDLPTFPADGELGVSGNWFGTRLWKYKGCTEAQKKKIDQAYADSHEIFSTVGPNIDFNSPAALEFFGPLSEDRIKQNQIQNAFNRLQSVVWPSPTGKYRHYILVECGHGSFVAQANIPEQKVTFTSIYFDDNSHPGFHTLLKKAEAYTGYARYDLSGYERNQATAFFHELLHLGHPVGAPDNHPWILDQLLTVRTGERTFESVGAYGTYLTKILARYPSETGYWTMRHTDSYVLFALAIYVEKKLGGIYPRLPIFTLSPVPDVTYSISYNLRSGGAIFDLSFGMPESPTCCAEGSLDMRALTPEYVFPAAYRKRKAQWVEGLFPSKHVTGKKLKILPLGDSTTSGLGSSDGNGYRKILTENLPGNTVDMIGSQKTGNMEDNDHEGHVGSRINDIASYTSACSQKPNVVLLHAGTNDMYHPDEWTSAPTHFEKLLDKVLKECSSAVVLAALIPPSKDRELNNRINMFNEGITQAIKDRADRAKRVLLVDMNAMFSTADLSDEVHPNDKGYEIMAHAWRRSLKRAEGLGWLK